MDNPFDWKHLYGTRCQSHRIPPRRPLIGITGNYGDKGCELAPGYYLSVHEAGAVPVVIPPIDDDNDIEDLLDRLDGLIFSGGGDLNPLFMGEQPSPALHGICPQRDFEELMLMRRALDRQIPMLCICRGIQLLGYVTGGTLVQDLGSDPQFAGKLIKHSQDLDRCRASHTVEIEKDSLLFQIFKSGTLAVNSFHHQAVSSTGNGKEALHVSARSCDGVIEAIESPIPGKSILGVQWHPETFILGGDRSQMPLFEWLAGEARSFMEAKSLHNRFCSLDTHCDTPMLLSEGARFDERNPEMQLDIHKMRDGHLDACIMAAYLPQKERDDESLKAATRYCDSLLDCIETTVNATEGVALAETPADVLRLKAQGMKVVMRGIENGYALGKDITNVERFRRRGVVYMTLCHNGDNDVCDSAVRTTHEHGGLSAFGRDVVKEMNRTGMLIDLSHGGEDSFWDALELSSVPIVCSHSSCRALCDHPRNLTDEQLRALAQKGGVCQVTFYPGFLSTDTDRLITVRDGVRHLLHAVSVAGIDHVGFGSDFDGGGGVTGLDHAAEVINFTRLLMAEGLGEDDLRKIWGGNFLRVMAEVQAAATM